MNWQSKEDYDYSIWKTERQNVQIELKVNTQRLNEPEWGKPTWMLTFTYPTGRKHFEQFWSYNPSEAIATAEDRIVFNLPSAT